MLLKLFMLTIMAAIAWGFAKLNTVPRAGSATTAAQKLCRLTLLSMHIMLALTLIISTTAMVIMLSKLSQRIMQAELNTTITNQ